MVQPKLQLTCHVKSCVTGLCEMLFFKKVVNFFFLISKRGLSVLMEKDKGSLISFVDVLFL